MSTGAGSNLDVRIRLIDAKIAQLEAQRTSRAISGIGRSAQTSGRQAREASGHFRLMSAAVSGFKFAAGAAGFGALAFGVKDVVEAGVQLQSQQAQLRQALAASGLAGTRAYEDINRAAERSATRGGFATTQNLQAITQFVRLTGDATRAIHLNAAATGLARGAHLDFSTSQRIVAQALTGNVGRLQRYLGIIQPVKDAQYALAQAHKVNLIALEAQAKAMGKAGPMWLRQQELLRGITPAMKAHAQLLDRQATAQMVLQRIQQRYGGSTSAFSRTAAGALSNARNALEQLGARLGVLLLPLITRIARALSGLAAAVGRHMGTIKRVVIAVVGPFIAVAKAIFGSKTAVQALLAVAIPLMAIFLAYRAVEAYKNAVVGVKGALVALKLATTETTGATIAFDTALDANPIGLVVAAIALLVAGLIFLALHFKQVGRVAGEVFDSIKAAVSGFAHAVTAVFQAVVGFIGSHWKLLLAVMTGGLGLAVYFIVGHLHQIGQVFGDVVRFVGRLATVLWSALTWPFRQAWKLIQGIFNGIVSAARWVVHQVTSVFGAITNAIGVTGGGGLLHGFGLWARGGAVWPKYMAAGGPIGSDTVPAMLTPGEFVLRRQVVAQVGMQRLNELNAGGGMRGEQTITIQPTPVTVKLDSRTLAQAIIQWTRSQSARGAHSLVGGAMTTGARTAY